MRIEITDREHWLERVEHHIRRIETERRRRDAEYEDEWAIEHFWRTSAPDPSTRR